MEQKAHTSASGNSATRPEEKSRPPLQTSSEIFYSYLLLHKHGAFQLSHHATHLILQFSDREPKH